MFEAALGIASPWSVAGVRFDEASKVLTVAVDYAAGSRFAVAGVAGVHPVYDSLTKRYRHLNFFQHECVLDKMRRIEQRRDNSLKGLRWTLLKDRTSLHRAAVADLDAPIARLTTVRTARAWLYNE